MRDTNDAYGEKGGGEENHGQERNRLHDRVVLVSELVEGLLLLASRARSHCTCKRVPYQIDFVLESLLIRLRAKL